MAKEPGYSLDVVAPIFPVSDPERSRDYYTGALGFRVGFAWSDAGDGPLDYVVLLNGNTELHVTRVSNPPKSRAYFFVSNVRGYYDMVRSTNAEITQEIADQPWEMREFEVVDPDGHVVIFGEHLSRISDVS